MQILSYFLEKVLTPLQGMKSYKRWFQCQCRPFHINSEKSERIIGGKIKSIRIFTATKNGKIIGSLFIQGGNFEESDFEYAVIYDVFVLPMYRRCGIAEHLIEESIKWIQKLGFNYVFVSTYSGNARATRMYTKIGFVQLGVDGNIPIGFSKEVAMYNRSMIGFYKRFKEFRNRNKKGS